MYVFFSYSWRSPFHRPLFYFNFNCFFFGHGAHVSSILLYCILKFLIPQLLFFPYFLVFFLIFYYGKNSICRKVDNSIMNPHVLFISFSIYQLIATIVLAIQACLILLCFAFLCFTVYFLQIEDFGQPMSCKCISAIFYQHLLTSCLRVTFW